MKKAFWMAAAAVLAIPAIAGAQNTMQHQGMKAHSMDEPVKRTDVQQKVAQHFGEMDTNKDGAVTRAEHDAYKQAMRTQRREAHFAAMDTNKDNQVSKTEFDAFHASKADMRGHRAGGGTHGGMKAGGRMGGNMFDRADANKDGKVTLAEMSAKALDMFDKADANKDGTVTPEEHRATREKMRAEWKAKTPKPGAPN